MKNATHTPAIGGTFDTLAKELEALTVAPRRRPCFRARPRIFIIVQGNLYTRCRCIGNRNTISRGDVQNDATQKGGER